MRSRGGSCRCAAEEGRRCHRGGAPGVVVASHRVQRRRLVAGKLVTWLRRIEVVRVGFHIEEAATRFIGVVAEAVAAPGCHRKLAPGWPECLHRSERGGRGGKGCDLKKTAHGGGAHRKRGKLNAAVLERREA